MDKKSFVIIGILLSTILFLNVSYSYVIKEEDNNLYNFNIQFEDNNNILNDETIINLKSNYELEYKILISGNYNDDDNIDVYINDEYYNNFNVKDLINIDYNKLLLKNNINGNQVIKLILHGNTEYKILIEK